MDYGSGTLFLTTENARWLETSGARELTFHWRSMLMHAVSRDTSSFPHPCIYCQVHTCTHTHKKYSRRDGRLMRLPGQVRKEDVPGAESNGTRGEGAQDEEEDEANGMMPDEEATRDVRYTVEDADMLGVLFQGCLSRPLFSTISSRFLSFLMSSPRLEYYKQYLLSVPLFLQLVDAVKVRRGILKYFLDA